ncbi:MAG TPA: hypothetical protein VKG63_13235 [Steroidobacteraceae bacterium]|nr:hypothetical protein [Steroidobacteraceae bacterium]
MSRNDEDRILHGLYYYRESIDEDLPVTGEQILWLAMHPMREGDGWNAEGRLQGIDTTVFPAEIRTKLVTAKLELPLRYLEYRRLIKYTKRKDGAFLVAVTFAGADRAIRLHTRRGRLDLWYREHKDGILGIAVTMTVAFLTALITALVMLRVTR